MKPKLHAFAGTQSCGGAQTQAPPIRAGVIDYKLAQVMRTGAFSEKEYMMCFAEGEHFHHIHFVAKPVNLPAEAKGPRIFSMLNIDERHAIPTFELKTFCEKLKEKYQAI